MQKRVPSSKRLFGFTYILADGRTAYYYLLLAQIKETILRHALKKGASCDLLEYGELVASGFGEPTEALHQELRKHYDT